MTIHNYFSPVTAKDAIHKAVTAVTLKGLTYTEGDVIVAINMSEPSNKKRMYIGQQVAGLPVVLSAHFVSHGINSSNPDNRQYAISFSNTIGSKQTSLGLAKTAEIYRGKHGSSLKLDGLDSTNSNMRQRWVVIHSAAYMTPRYIDNHSRAGQSEGCFAVGPQDIKFIIDTLKHGTYIYTFI